jgi:hypothetical protein
MTDASLQLLMDLRWCMVRWNCAARRCSTTPTCRFLCEKGMMAAKKKKKLQSETVTPLRHLEEPAAEIVQEASASATDSSP